MFFLRGKREFWPVKVAETDLRNKERVPVTNMKPAIGPYTINLIMI